MAAEHHSLLQRKQIIEQRRQEHELELAAQEAERAREREEEKRLRDLAETRRLAEEARKRDLERQAQELQMREMNQVKEAAIELERRTGKKLNLDVCSFALAAVLSPL